MRTFLAGLTYTNSKILSGAPRYTLNFCTHCNGGLRVISEGARIHKRTLLLATCLVIISLLFEIIKKNRMRYLLKIFVICCKSVVNCWISNLGKIFNINELPCPFLLVHSKGMHCTYFYWYIPALNCLERKPGGHCVGS